MAPHHCRALRYTAFVALLALACTRTAHAQLLNRPPHFVAGTGDMTRFSLSENTPVGSPVYQLRGVDPEGSAIKYSISGPVFSVDRETGVVRLRQELDRESQDVVEVIISITDQGVYNTEPNTVSLRREIPIRDYNDNHPQFVGREHRAYVANVRESYAVGEELDVQPPIVVVDRDEGINAELQISCVPENDICETFDVRSYRNSEGNYSARIVLKKPLDYESRPSYVMTVAASDGALENRLTSFASISVNVIDVQDQPPVFVNAPYSATVEENTRSGVSILTIKAHDGDVGIPRDIFLSLENENGGHFTLHPLDVGEHGGVAELRTTDVPLDRENPNVLQNGGVYVFTVRATELIDGEVPADFATTRVTIVITDVNDHVPEFNKDFFNISIPENLGNGMPLPGLSVFVDDRDMGENSRYQLSLRDVENSADIFAVSPVEGQGRTPVVVRVLDSSRLDYDVEDDTKRKFVFELIASVEGAEEAVTRIEVHLLDANDNMPVFNSSSYRFTVAENQAVNTKIGTVKASDKDSQSFGHITYVLKGFGSDNFYIDSETGEIFIQKPLDYEHQSSFSLSVVAVDGGGRESNANIYVDITDVNDNAPVFESKEYTRTIREGTGTFEPQFFIRAHDIDGPLQGGGKLKYAIVSENSIAGNVFRIDSETGEITLQKVARSMDTERGEYELVVSATDFGEPPLSSTTNVLIRVGISGNQRPIFKGHFQNVENLPVVGPPSYRVSIPENAEPGSNLTSVSAHDPDGLDSLLRYRIVGANDNFEIDEITGVITVSPQAHIDRDANMDSFEITVNAVDSGLPIPETATSTVYVTVMDINDEVPKFEHASYVGYVSERTAVGESVLRVRAIDKDLSARLEYAIKGVLKTTTKAGVSHVNHSNYRVQEAFRIDKETGEIFVNSSLRHDVAAVITFSVEVRDLNAEVNSEGQTDMTEVTIYVQSFKDTNPVFMNKGWTSSRPVVHVNVKEEMPIDSVMFILHAEDPVTKLPINSFELVEPKQLEYFHVHDRTGEVILRKRLDYEALEPGRTEFEFQVKANSPDGQRSTITKVNVTVENVNDNSPTFEEASYHATIIENTVHPGKVLQVRATDKDAVLTARDESLGYHRIAYTLQGENSALFEINNVTGEIIVAANHTIDREVTPHLHLQVKAEDSAGRPTDSKQSVVNLTIDVLDVNDNAPEFAQPVYTAVIPENAPVDSYVARIVAVDPDDGPGGEVHYELVDEGEVNGLFKINSQTGELRTKRPLTGKGRADFYKMIVRAQDNGGQVPKQQSLSSDVDVKIFIGDVSANDGIPYFISPKIGQIANISENSPSGTPVFQVIANDPDDPATPSGMLSYKILKDDKDSYPFSIDENTGLITSTEILDRETKSMYYIILEVYDNGLPRQSVTRVLQIDVIDVDDHQPEFLKELGSPPLELSVLEESPSGTLVGNFSAFDQDIGENALIDYVIIEGNEDNIFEIQRDDQNAAILRTTQPIDRELVESYTITVKCFKLTPGGYKYSGESYSPSDPSHLRVSVKIIDLDDNAPVFDQENLSIGIRINVPLDTVITRLHASDRDAEAKPIVLAIDNVTFVPQFYKRTRKIKTHQLNNLFSLNNHTGELRTSGSFADYVDGYFHLTVRANNSADPRRHTHNVVKVFVIRDKSLLKFVFARPPSEIQSMVRPFQDKLQQKLRPFGYELHILDTQVLTRPDWSLDFTATSSCFQLFKNGSAMSFQEMQKFMNSELVRQELLTHYVEYGVSEVEPCSVRRALKAATIISSAGTWLVILAALIGVAAIVATLTACCLRKKYRQHSKSSLQASRAPTEPVYPLGVPAVFYSEPIYGPL